MTYVELHAHSYYSLLDGASAPDALVRRAAEVGMGALALTDHDALYGAIPFVEAARTLGVRPILGAEITLERGHHLTLLVRDARGWANLCRLITEARHRAPKGEARLLPAALEGRGEGLVCLSGCRAGPVARALLAGDRGRAAAAARWLRDRFAPGDFYIEIQHHLRPDDDRLVGELVTLAEALELPVVATNNVHYATRESHALQDLLVAIRHNLPLDRVVGRLRPNSEYALEPGEVIAARLGGLPAALAASAEIAARCEYAPPTGLQALPRYPTPAGRSAIAHLRALCEAAIPYRYGDAAGEAVTRQLDHELGVIERAGLANYFLVVWDIVRYAREAGIRCQGRGSACNSLVAYLLAIGPIDPLRHDLVFERFLSDERRVVPDIDLDLQADRREEVIQYVYRRYGVEHVAMACTFSRYRARGALRDAAKALGIPPAALEHVRDVLDGRGREALEASPELGELAGRGELWHRLTEMAGELQGLPRHLGLHNGGMVVTDEPLAARLPSEPARMEARTVVQWDKDMLEDAGLIKIDLLGLRMLSVLAESVTHIERVTGTRVDLDALTFDDPAIYAMITRADTIGLFQVESRAQAQVLPRLRPRRFEDLIISISLIRPGPIQGDMVHPYLRRREGREPVRYTHPSLEPVLGSTLGVILFQEQVLQVSRALAGFTPGQGEQLRRALGKDPGALDPIRTAFLRGARAGGVSAAVAEEVWAQLAAFGGYSFAKSHAAAFAVIVYQSAWLKRYHPAPFFTALLNQQPMGFWSPAVLVGDARRHGVEVRPVDIARSETACTVEGARAMRIGLSYVKGMGELGSARVVAARERGGFADLADFCRRTRLPRRLVERLIAAGAMDGWGMPRRKLLWRLGLIHYEESPLALDFPDGGVTLPPLPEVEALGWERETMGLSTRPHLLAFYRGWLAERGILDSRDVERTPGGRVIRAAGMLVMHQAPPTAKGVRFLTLEDEFGLINVVVRQPVYERYRTTLRRHHLLLVEGTIQRRDAVTNLVASRATAMVHAQA